MEEDLLQLIFDNTSYFSGLLSPKGKLLRCNQISLELIHCKESEVIGKYFWDCPWWTHSSEEQALLKSAISRAARGESSSFETTHLDFEGRVHYVLFSIKPIRNKNNEIAYLLPEGKDVTRQVEAEQSLIESEAKFRNLFEKANDAILLIRENKFIDCNAKTLEMFGCLREEIVGNSPYNFSPEFQPDGRSSSEKSIAKIQAAMTEGGQIFEWTHCKYNKEEFEAEVSLNLVNTGDSSYILAIIRNIKERNQFEKALRLSEYKFNRIFNQSPVAIVLSELETGIIRDVNSAFEEIFLFTKAEVIGKTSMELGIVSPTVRAKAREGIAQVRRVKDAEIVYYNKNKETIQCLGSADIMEIEGKQLVLQSITDITKLKNASEAVKESEQRFRSIFELSPLAIALIDFEKRVLIDVNDAFTRSYNLKREDVIGTDAMTLVRFSDPSKREEYLEAIASDGSVVNFEIELLFENRPNQILLITSFFTRLKDEVIMVNISNNITAIRTYQKELLIYQNQLESLVKERTEKIEFQNNELQSLNEELTSSNDELNSRKEHLERTLEELKKMQSQLVLSEKMASLGTLIAGIAHELNNPLNFISSGLNLMEMNIGSISGEAGEEITAALDMMKKGLTNSSNILKALMTYSYHGQSSRQPTDINDLIRSTLLFINASLPKNTDLINDFKLDRPVAAFPDKLHQVFVNLMTNAIFEISRLRDAERRVIKISTSRIDRESGAFAVLKFYNSGSHIDEAHFDHIFDPFYTTKQPGEGTGLGLSISFSLIKEHNGIIRAQNLTDGVVFIIELPI